jgi:transcriptional regulator with XRE-family HTH domain
VAAGRTSENFAARVTRRIAEARQAKGLTQEELAALLETAPRNVQRIEAGQNLTLGTIERIAHALGLEPEDLVVGAGSTGMPARGGPRKYKSRR